MCEKGINDVGPREVVGLLTFLTCEQAVKVGCRCQISWLERSATISKQVEKWSCFLCCRLLRSVSYGSKVPCPQKMEQLRLVLLVLVVLMSQRAELSRLREKQQLQQQQELEGLEVPAQGARLLLVSAADLLHV